MTAPHRFDASMSMRVVGALAVGIMLLLAHVPIEGRVVAAQRWAVQTDPRQEGEAHFARVCQRCHGAQGRGDSAPRLVPFARDVDEVLGIVREGVGQMPPISARELSDEAVGQIVEYLKALAP